MINNDFNSLFNNYYSKMVIFANGYVRDNDIAKDFAVEAFTVYWENKQYLKPDTVPQKYILTVVKNKCLNYLQHLKVRKKAEGILIQHSNWHTDISIQTLKSCNPDALFSQEISKIVNETLDKLPQKTKYVYIMSREKGLTYKEIALDMGLSIKSVEFHISKALAKLRLELKDYILLYPFLLYIL